VREACKIEIRVAGVEVQSTKSAKGMRQTKARRLTEASSSLSAVAREWTLVSLANSLHDSSTHI
jgi:hypothetical protein